MADAVVDTAQGCANDPITVKQIPNPNLIKFYSPLVEVINLKTVTLMETKKFDPKKLNKLNDPARIKFQSPEKIWETLQLSDPKILVDIGAGTGFFAMPFCDQMLNGTVYACDMSETMVSWMVENLPDRYRDRVIPLKSEENSCDLQDELADLVYMINLHHELDAPLTMLKEAYRMLKTGGTLMVIDWKAEETPMGPPQEIRIPVPVLQEQFSSIGLSRIQSHDGMPYHSFVTGIK